MEFREGNQRHKGVVALAWILDSLVELVNRHFLQLQIKVIRDAKVARVANCELGSSC